MAGFASVSIRFLADLQQFSSQMQNATRQINSLGKQLQSTGRTLSASVTLPLAAVATASVAAYSELEGVSIAFERLNKPGLLDDLRKATKGTVADLELMQAAVKADNFQIPLEQLGSLLEFARRRAKDTGESVDFLVNSIVTGIGRKSPLILDNLGISAAALKDELDGASAASSSIAEVTEAVGKIAREELTKMGDDANTLSESFLQVKASVSNLFAEFGGIISEFIAPLVSGLQNVLQGFQQLSPETKRFIVILGGVGAAIGPLLALSGAILPSIATGFALLTGPVGLLVAGLTAIGVIIIKNWAPIKRILIDIANYFIDLYNESQLVRVGVELIANTFKNFFEIGKFVFETLKNIIGGFVDNVVNDFKVLGQVIKAALTGDLSSIPDIIQEGVIESGKSFKGFTKELAADWEVLTTNMKQNGKEALDAITERRKIEFLEEDIDASGIENAVATAVTNGIKSGTAGEGGRAKVQPLDVPLQAEGFSNILPNFEDQFTAFDEGLSLFEIRLQEFNENASLIIQGAAQNFAAGFGNIIGAIATGAAPLSSISSLILNSIGNLLQQLGRAAINIGITMQKIQASFSNPLAAIAAGIAAIALGSIIKSVIPQDLQRFQDGGIVGGSSFYGDKILARVNSGELILNQSQQRSLYGQLNTQAALGPVVLETRISGEDLVLVQSRANKTRNRTT